MRVFQPYAAPAFRLVAVLLVVMALLPACQAPASPHRAKQPLERLVFAHYFPPLPVSLDDADPATDYYQVHYLRPEGENGKHAGYGGYLRDRPLPRPIRGGDWRFADLRSEVRQAMAGEIDGFALNIIEYPGEGNGDQVTTVRTMMRAAEAVDPDFRIMLMLDMSGKARSKPQADIASFVAELAASSAAYRLRDGRLVLSAFMAEAQPPRWWEGLFNLLRTTYELRVAFVPTFLDEQVHQREFAPISYGMGNWGDRNPVDNEATANSPSSHITRVDSTHRLGKRWMQPVSIQDERPREGVFEEAENTKNLRNTWAIAREGSADWVQLTTWNDYTEGTHLAPSVMHGHGFLDLNSYYVRWYKTGVRPKVLRDTIYLTHRLQPWATQPSYSQSLLMQPRGGSQPRDIAEALTFLTEPATVTIASGTQSKSCQLPAGEATCTLPLSAGTVRATVTRNGRTAASVTSPHEVSATPYVQDLQYVIASSKPGAPHAQ